MDLTYWDFTRWGLSESAFGCKTWEHIIDSIKDEIICLPVLHTGLLRGRMNQLEQNTTEGEKKFDF